MNKRHIVNILSSILTATIAIFFSLYLSAASQAPKLYWVIIAIISVVLITVLVLRYRDKLLGLFRNVSKSVKILLTLAFLQILIASICFWAYRSNPKIYVNADELENRKIELLRLDSMNSTTTISDYKQKLEFQVDLLTYIQQNKDSFRSDESSSLVFNDSLLIVVSQINSPPGSKTATSFQVFDRSKLRYMEQYVSYSKEIFSGLTNEISERKKLVKEAVENLASYNKLDYRWSYFQFLNLYFRERLDAMPIIFQFTDYVRYILYFFMSAILGSLISRK